MPVEQFAAAEWIFDEGSSCYMLHSTEHAGMPGPHNAIIRVDLTSQEIKNLRASPKQLVAAPGSGKVVEPVSVMLKLTPGSNVLTTLLTSLVVRYNNGTGLAFTDSIPGTGVLDLLFKSMVMFNKKAISGQLTKFENLPIMLHNDGAADFGGNASNDAVLSAYVIYRILVL